MQEAKNVWRKKNKGRKWPRPDGACVSVKKGGSRFNPLFFSPELQGLGGPPYGLAEAPPAQHLEVANDLSLIGLNQIKPFRRFLLIWS